MPGNNWLARVVDVARVARAGHGGRPANVLVQQAGGEHQLVVDGACGHMPANTGLVSGTGGIAGLVVGFAGGVALVIVDPQAGAVEKALIAAFRAAGAGECCPVVVEFIFSAHNHGLADLLGTDAFEDVGVSLRRLEHMANVAEADHHRAAINGPLVGFISVKCELPAVATVIHGQRGERALFGLFVDAGVAVAIHAVKANAKALFVAQATAEIQVLGKIAVRHITGGQAGQRFFPGAFGHQVNHAAHATAGCHAGQQGTRAFEHFDAVQKFGRHVAVRGHAVQAIECQLCRV